MSCHNIGHGINTVNKEILKLLSEEKINFEVAFHLLCVARDAINYCDGNSYEAVECLEDKCGVCLKEKATTNIYDLPEEKKHLRCLLEDAGYSSVIVNGFICDKCIDKLLIEYKTNLSHLIIEYLIRTHKQTMSLYALNGVLRFISQKVYKEKIMNVKLPSAVYWADLELLDLESLNILSLNEDKKEIELNPTVNLSELGKDDIIKNLVCDFADSRNL